MTTETLRTHRWRMPRFGLPLLAKELQEQSSRRRTYVVRTGYAVLLFLSAFLLFNQTVQATATTPTQVLGQGRQIFDLLVTLQFFGIYLFTPGLVCGVVTHEKERDSLALLILTRLSPSTILLEKLLSRLVVMFSFELMLLPLLGLAYTLGGVPWEGFLRACWFLGLATVQMGCLALCCSAFFRTTVQAFVASYVLEVVLLFGWSLLRELRVLPDGPLSSSLADLLGLPPREVVLLFFAPALYYLDSMRGMAAQAAMRGMPVMPGIPPGVLLKETILRSVPIAGTCVIFFLLARVFVIRRAFVTPLNLALKVFRWLDSAFLKFNKNRVTRGVILIQPRVSSPDLSPVAWRETTKSAMGSPTHLLRVVLLLEIPVLVLCVIAAAAGEYGLRVLPLVLSAAFAIVILIISVRAAGLIAGERSHQTLDVLLTSPLTTREILTQKFRSLYRGMLALSIPLLTSVGFEATYRGINQYGDYGGGFRFNGLMYLVASLLTLSVYMFLVAWMSFYIGLRSASRPRAILASVGSIVGLCVLPILLIVIPLGILVRPIVGYDYRREHLGLYLWQLSPVSFLGFVEFGNSYRSGEIAFLGLVWNTVLFGGLCLFFRWQCLKHGDKYLRR